MPDIRLVQDSDAFPAYQIPIDWSLLSDGTLDDTQALATAVIVALGTDRLANTDDVLPDPDSTDRAGWWGDLDAEELFNGWPIGTRLWLLKRTKIVGPEDSEGATVSRVEQYIIEAIQPTRGHEDRDRIRRRGGARRGRADRRPCRDLSRAENAGRAALPSAVAGSLRLRQRRAETERIEIGGRNSLGARLLYVR